MPWPIVDWNDNRLNEGYFNYIFIIFLLLIITIIIGIKEAV